MNRGQAQHHTCGEALIIVFVRAAGVVERHFLAFGPVLACWCRGSSLALAYSLAADSDASRSRPTAGGGGATTNKTRSAIVLISIRCSLRRCTSAVSTAAPPDTCRVRMLAWRRQL
ncbi:hypothetical protein JDV02_007817 [Purpureocillium takamizusanense]|uniref:Uncharacterized protein n=1 Tax=Purpureocillium takamizusanense TaxID=2060973 RepID=A0A9Q8QMD2_9HYPO|nr:uncharacterized protein JDV02_007817 [Purpureocillium takamizusanense]UNI21867.1 hypothetical protein JDV02_007817 [Purpureocillium takamizusanense]